MFNCKFTHKIEISKIFIKKIEKYPFFCFHRQNTINPPSVRKNMSLKNICFFVFLSKILNTSKTAGTVCVCGSARYVL